jgi:hypothetical protein
VFHADRIVWLTYERTFGYLVTEGAHFSRIRYQAGGMEWDVLVENDEFEIILDYEDDDEQD